MSAPQETKDSLRASLCRQGFLAQTRARQTHFWRFDTRAGVADHNANRDLYLENGAHAGTATRGRRRLKVCLAVLSAKVAALRRSVFGSATRSRGLHGLRLSHLRSR